MRAFLKWAGGKSRITSEIKKHFKIGNRLIEPFVGSGAVFLNTSFSNYLLCDKNEDLINLYKNLQKQPAKLIALTRDLFSIQNNTESRFYEFREKFNSLESDDILKSALFVYLNKHAYNGLCRYNRKGFYNVPYGKYRAPKFPQTEMEDFAKKSKAAKFKCQDFEKTFGEAKLGDVIYCDPPYVPLSITSSFTSYSKEGFGMQDQIRLAKNAKYARLKGIQCVISNHDLDFIRDLYEKSDIYEIKVQRSIASKSTSRTKVAEIIAVF